MSRMRILAAAAMAAVAVVAAGTMPTPVYACRDCDSAEFYCSHTCGDLGIDKWFCKTVQLGYTQCNAYFTSCRLGPGGVIVEDCDSWCNSQGDACGSPEPETTKNGSPLASWTRGDATSNSRCLRADPEPTD